MLDIRNTYAITTKGIMLSYFAVQHFVRPLADWAIDTSLSCPGRLTRSSGNSFVYGVIFIECYAVPCRAWVAFMARSRAQSKVRATMQKCNIDLKYTYGQEKASLQGKTLA
jgi:hypothetical protein